MKGAPEKRTIRGRVKAFKVKIADQYEKRVGTAPYICVCEAAQGAEEWLGKAEE
jgi:galactokinase